MSQLITQAYTMRVSYQNNSNCDSLFVPENLFIAFEPGNMPRLIWEHPQDSKALTKLDVAVQKYLKEQQRYGMVVEGIRWLKIYNVEPVKRSGIYRLSINLESLLSKIKESQKITRICAEEIWKDAKTPGD